jgi:hypothetical protein
VIREVWNLYGEVVVGANAVLVNVPKLFWLALQKSTHATVLDKFNKWSVAPLYK